jgi:hypothetical protein
VTTTTTAPGPRVCRDPLTGYWHAYPRPGRVLKSDVTGHGRPYPTRAAAVAALRKHLEETPCGS